MFIFWIVLIIVVIYLFKDKINFNSGQGHNNDEAEEILKKRYVNGEIDEETFLRMKKDLWS